MSKLTHNRAVDSQTETRIVAMIARGDSYSSIVDQLAEEGIEIGQSTVGAIKKRNPEALAHIQKTLLDRETTHAQQILAKSRTLINTRLTKAMKLEDELAELHRQHRDGEIESEEYRLKFDQLMSNALSITELNQVSKEAFNQSQVEAGKPTSITENPDQAKKNLEVLLRAIAEGDTGKMLDAVFIDHA